MPRVEIMWRQTGRRVVAAALALAVTASCAGMDDPDEAPWVEAATVLPAFPQDADLLPFHAGAATTNHFFVDAKSLSPGNDGVIRYALIIKTGGGATNVSFEGIRCRQRQFKLYATGRHDRSWGPLLTGAWRPVQYQERNAYRWVLARDFFCPNGAPIQSAEEGRDALRRGKHPQAQATFWDAGSAGE